MSSLQDKVAIVTGAAAGIGQAIAASFIKEGARVCMADLDGTVKKRAEELGNRAESAEMDVSLAEDWRRTVSAIMERHGRIDILVNNAGIHGAAASLGTLSEGSFDDLMRINVKGVFLGMREVLPEMARAGAGAIINITSIAVNGAAPRSATYAATKSAVASLTRGAAVEYGPAGIRVNGLSPGVIRTAMQNPLIEEKVVAATALRRIGEPGDIASAAVFLACDMSRFITGEIITVDGGFTLKLPVSSGDIMWSEPGWEAQTYSSG